MTTIFEEAYAEACAYSDQTLVTFETVQIESPDLDDPIRVVNDYVDLTAKLETGEVVTFTRFAFSALLPDLNAAGNPEAVITVDNASAEIARELLKISGSSHPLKVSIRYFNSDALMDGPKGRVGTGEMRNVQVDENQVTLRIGYGQINNLPFPSEVYTMKHYPSIYRS